ncbi:MAG TPA: GAF domain-containing SpoIIE family protein phosphatase [Anaerolineaceae bacterium]|nr:GAF domain-containing SpoIIE family protein phosphatase [Anaerolineaceae bacterium]
MTNDKRKERVWLQRFLKRFTRSRPEPELQEKPDAQAEAFSPTALNQEIDPDDPIVAYFQKSPSAVDITRLDLPNSPALSRLKSEGVALVVPLISQGEFVGLLNLGPRLSQQEYSSDDRTLLNNLATQVAPALRVAQLVHQQQAEILQRQQMEHELRIARMIQQSLLPKELPDIPGWELAAHYQPAKAVGGDFYDFFRFQSGEIGIVIGDVTDKGIPAAMVMATTRAILRSVAFRQSEPGDVLATTNNQLNQDIPQNMFVTCLYIILDPVTGRMRYSNAGHNLPLRQSDHTVDRLWATGMPLGLMPNMNYEQKEGMIYPGERLLLYSDGLVEAHNPAYDMFGMDRLQNLLSDGLEPERPPEEVIDSLLLALSRFTGADWEQEDDVTLVTLQRLPPAFANTSDIQMERINQNA